MIEAGKRPKILLLHGAPTAAGQGSCWHSLAKALKPIAELEANLREEKEIAGDALASLATGFDFTFLDTSLAPWQHLKSSGTPENLVLIAENYFPWNDLALRQTRLDALVRTPLLVLEGLSPGNLARILAHFLSPRRLSGVTPLADSGSLIVGEKLLDASSVGQLLDKISTFLEQRLEPELLPRIADFRQVLSGLCSVALRHGYEKGVQFPFVDFQALPGPDRLVVSLRFPLAADSTAEILRGALGGTSIFWEQIWQCSDQLLLTHHEAHGELEVTALLYRTEQIVGGQFRTLLHRTNRDSHPRPNLLAPPARYEFRLLSELGLSTADTQVAEETAVQEKTFGSDTPFVPVTERLEGSLRAAEAEKIQLREGMAFAQRRATALEQKYAGLLNDFAAKERELGETKASLLRIRQDALTRGRSTGPVAMQQVNAEMEERQKMYEAKMKEAVARELSLQKKIEDLMALLKKASKVA